METSRSRTPLYSIIVTLAFLTAAACGDDGPPTGNDGEDPGSLEVTTSTTGQEIDSDGYTLTVDDEDRDIGVNATVTIEDLQPGDHGVALGGLADNCAMEGEASRTVSVPEGDVAQVTFDVACAETLENVILFTSFRDGNLEVYRMNADGSGQMNLSNTPGRDLRPSVPLNGSKVAFSTSEFGDLEVATMLSDGSGVTRVTNSEGVNHRPMWFPDGTQIAFASTRDGGELEIYVINEDGSDPQRLTNHQAVDTHPAPSPDGSQIAFTSTRDGGTQDVYVMNVDGSNITRLTDTGENFRPAWSPDGSQIAFTSERDGNQEVYVMNADGSNQTNITNLPANDAEPWFSPDGTRIAFSSNRNDSDFEIYTMDPDGQNVSQPLTTTAGTDEDPMWGGGG